MFLMTASAGSAASGVALGEAAGLGLVALLAAAGDGEVAAGEGLAVPVQADMASIAANPRAGNLSIFTFHSCFG